MFSTCRVSRTRIEVFVVVSLAWGMGNGGKGQAQETVGVTPVEASPGDTSALDVENADREKLTSVGANDSVREEESLEVEAPPRFAAPLLDAFLDGDLKLDLRGRVEIVEQDGTDTSQAYTERLRLGYGTKPLHGLSFYVDFEDIRSVDDGLYNAAGLNGEPDKAVVADPEDTELNQFLARYDGEYFGAVAGRQRMTLDDHRFLGNVGWRQNEQTLDAYTLTSDWIPETSILYSYVDDVNRIFGPDARRDFRSDTHLVNVSYQGLPGLKLTAFGYFLDFGNSAADSSDSFGLRAAGQQTLASDFSVGYVASYARQVDAGDNPNDYEADYYLLEATISKKGLGKAGVGYEVLGSDGGDAAFRTPLATLHKFNGWADLFLVTPDDGLEDLYALAGLDLPLGLESLAVYHLFFSQDRSRDIGGEFDALLKKKVNEHLTVLGKLAVFHSESAVPKTQKYWFQMEFGF